MLAAGASTRLGQPKQLLPFRGTTLLGHAVRTAQDAALGPVVLVLGAEPKRCRTALEAIDIRDVHVVLNAGWQEGLASSIRAGVQTALLGLKADAVLLTTCDQPFVTASDLRRLATRWRRTGAELVAARYRGTVGIPALFSGDSIRALSQLTGDRGAKVLLEAAGDRLVTVSCPSAARDIDTPEDVDTLG